MPTEVLEAKEPVAVKGQTEMTLAQDLAFKNGFFSGDVRSNVPHGEGTYTSNSFMYTGSFVDGRLEGKCVIEDFLTGTEYEGDIVDGKLTGKGKYTFADGSIYDGEVENGKFQGDGQFTL